ncbi:MAG: spermidine/putrescine ABC transporter substrate-binding protein [Pseudanabaena frigida]|uniref:Spermidine/putrescine ABC transporter substrate-binding protein n=1 Tax=Pseudanabaena frigida TaxID=945775 RepID=A0A2W4XS07_9CYAN|nr:MAG: spermidine/putrescine ABC transporter substrate-binding protein [Pseudanabaena frigida]
MDRRKFLVLGGAAIAGIGGCQWSNPFDRSERLRILGLLGALPSKVINQFESTSQKKTEYKAENLPSKLWQELQNYPTSSKDKAQNLISIGDSWLDLAIAQSLIQPIAPDLLAKMPQWQKLSPIWQNSVTRNNQVWGIPYRWGATAIAYRGDKLKFDITQWSDLWRSELQLKLTLPDDAREVIGLVLKKMGQSYQQENLLESRDIATLTQELKSLNSQVLTYTSDNYLQSLLADDSLVAVGWTSDMYKAKRQNPNLKVVIPQDGTALWSDIWVIPKGEVAIAATEWMDFCLTPAIAAQITSLTDAVSPSSDLSQVPDSVKADPIKFFPQSILAKSELISPLSQASLLQYKDIWTKLRSGTL